MSIYLKSSQQPKLSSRFLHTEPAKPIYSGHHATVNCECCNRTMVPRVVSYYGQPLKSFCPFCGSTFTKFPTGFTRFIRGGYSDVLSFSVFKKLAAITTCLVVLWFVADWGNLPDNISLFAGFGTAFFLAMTLAELVFQGIERLADKLWHKSNYYWALLVFVAMIIAHEQRALAGYVAVFFFIIIARGFVAALLQNREKH